MRLRDFLEIDYLMLAAATALTVFGVLFIYSSGLNSAGVLVSSEYLRQIIWGLSGFIIAVTLAILDYRRIKGLALWLYLGILALLIYTCLFGRLVNGARAWLGIGAFGIQPSEFAKIITILFLARHLADSGREIGTFPRFAVSCLIVVIPMGIILAQPDFGTSLVFIPILLAMTFVAGVPARYLAFLILCIAITGGLLVLPLWQTYILRSGSPSLAFLNNPRIIATAGIGLAAVGAVAWFGNARYGKRYFYWIFYAAAVAAFSLCASFAGRKVLKDYQIMRLIVFLDPEVDPQGAGWNIIQSVIAIGSGGLTGKGYLQGTQSHYRFLPQQSTDFIFSIFSEEWGLAGGLLVFGLFLLIALRLLRIIKTTADPFGAYIAAGLAGMFIFHFFINVGMTMGIMPITGIPLLFMSYGGSSIISAMAGIGLAQSVHVRRFLR